MTTLGENIKYARERVGMSQKVLADMLGVTPQTVYRWEKGDREPKWEILQEIASKLNVHDLVDFPDKPELNQPTTQTQVGELPNFIYWGQVIENARKVVKSGNIAEISAVFKLLELAVSDLAQAMKVLPTDAITQDVDKVSFEGNYNNYRGNQVNISRGDENDKNA